jgi:malonyl CoA-acyl carrier protein transacylase
MNTGLLFAGQGSQQPRMLHDLVARPAVDETLSEVSAILDIRSTLESCDELRIANSLPRKCLITSRLIPPKDSDRKGTHITGESKCLK